MMLKRGGADPARVDRLLKEYPVLFMGAKITGGKKEHREFVAETMDKMAAEQEVD